MIRSITRIKSMDEIEILLKDSSFIFILGCGTCPTLTSTGGPKEVEEMKERLESKNKYITGTGILPVACDEFTFETLSQFGKFMEQADTVLVMSCAYGVQTVARHTDKDVIPVLDTLFIGKETGLGIYQEVCKQCGQCIIGLTAAICPITACHKGLINGPCGGTNDGRCEIDPNRDCAWTVIYNRLKRMGKIERMKEFSPPKDHQASVSPGIMKI